MPKLEIHTWAFGGIAKVDEADEPRLAVAYRDSAGQECCVSCDHLAHTGRHCPSECSCGWSLNPAAINADGTVNVDWPGAVWADEPFAM